MALSSEAPARPSRSWPRPGPPLLFDLSAWRGRDAVEIAAAALERARVLGSRQVQHDATGVGFAQGAIMALINDGGLAVSGINGGKPAPDQVRLQEGPRQVPAAQRFANLKAYGWWIARGQGPRSAPGGSRQAPACGLPADRGR
jgi:hypothetical protein